MKFYDTGEAPRKNISVMEKVATEIANEAGAAEVSTSKSEKKKKKKRDRKNGEEASAALEAPPSKKKKKTASA